MKKPTAAQQRILDTLELPEAKIVGDYITHSWQLSYRDGGFRPTQPVRESVLRSLLQKNEIALSKEESEKGIFVYKKARAKCCKCMKSNEARAELTWNTAYPDRTPWDKLTKETQEEWLRVFSIYDSLSNTCSKQ